MISQHSRRDVLRLSAAGAAAMVVPDFVRAEEPKKKIPIALELYSLRTLIPKDFPGMIEAVGKMGFQGVEFAGYHGWDKKPQELRKLLDDNGLKCCGTHTALPTLEGDALKQTIELHQILGNKYLICPYMKANDVKGWLDLSQKFNEISARCKEQGMFVGYHSHQHDFTKIDGKTSWEIFFDNTVPEVVHQIDTGNCLQGGGDPLAMIKKYPGRTKTTHIKEFGGAKGAPLGEGTMDWPAMFAAYESVGGTEWYIVEYEDTRAPLENIKKCIDYLRKLGK